MRFILCFLMLLVFYPTLSFAQENKTQSDRLMAEPSKKQMNEARNFLNQCRMNVTMNKRHNCKCLTMQFLEKRVEMGDEVKGMVILSKLRNVCLNGAEGDMKELGYKEMSEVPEEILEEAELVHKTCADSWGMSTYHDCDCIAGKFIDDRLESGPLASAEAIVARYQNVCKNTVDLAGYQYTRCMSQYELMVPDDLKPKYYCECYASTYAKKYGELYDRPTSDTEGILMNASEATCIKKLSTDEKYKR